MPRARSSKAALTARNPPSPPLSEKNTIPAHKPPPITDNTSLLSSQQSDIADTIPFDEDEEVLEETEHTTDTETDKPKKPVYAGGYNALKSFQGQVYSGMAVGGSHTWTYDEGRWKETKEEPDLWRIDYRTNKRRARKAPQGSGAPVGTEYRWLVVAHQHVKKVDANTYETHLTGSKYKLAYKSASSNSWSIPTVKKQREREVELLEDAKKRVQRLPPVLATEKVKVEKREKGQQSLESLFSKAASAASDSGSKKRKIDRT
ncbi:uncharacterized protein ACLA_017070 [Aspergillus clavatus NRRL 1]|uniref:Uncharacterized protein n=1 Tax=Aspergillus clavatus (strain ATCC 1007 / CBS 513.65 / DSM 816 / NCTC 3887 / NRRL 1 / QM 1276 / 107) TaxID=344612 RepID=A1CBZ3_ASPCL|nr:uncharacterized protein ACLA_017070 [Aspergillus clavatus NRRL 1]EAW13261.1 conserved hypothetical protein [Aspergillus clavatus NRRL 1]